MIENRPLVAVLVEKDLAEQYQNNAGVIDLRALLASSSSTTIPFSWEPNSISTEDFWSDWGLFNYDTNPNLVGITSLIWTGPVNITNGLYLTNCQDLITLDLSKITDIDGSADGISITDNLFLTSIILSNLIGSTSAGLTITGNTNLTFLDISSLVAVTLTLHGSSIVNLSAPLLTSLNSISNNFDNNSVLQVIDFPSLDLTGFSGSISIKNCNLNAATVNAFLAKAVAGGMTSGTLDFSGGTNSAPTGQGITDKSDLISAGVTVTTN